MTMKGRCRTIVSESPNAEVRFTEHVPLIAIYILASQTVITMSAALGRRLAQLDRLEKGCLRCEGIQLLLGLQL
jgi:hypothetical protein